MAKKKRIKAARIENKDEWYHVLFEVVSLQVQQNKLKLELSEKQIALAEEYDPQIKPLDDLISAKSILLEDWLSNNREILGGKKSIETHLATVGFRKNPPSVKKRRSKDTLAAIALRLLSLPWGKKYVKKPAPTIDKDAVLAARDKLTAKQMIEAGFDIQNKDEFFVDPKGEALEQGVKL